MHGTWRIAAFTDPKAPAIGEASFLRRGLRPRAARGGAEARATRPAPRRAGRDRGGGPLPLRRAGRRASTSPAASPCRRRQPAASRGSTASRSASTTRRSRPHAGDRGAQPHRCRGQRQGRRSRCRRSRPAPARGQGHAAPWASPAGGRCRAASPCRSCRTGRCWRSARASRTIWPDGGTAGFDVVMAAPDGTRLAQGGVTWTLSRLEQTYQWYRADGRWWLRAGEIGPPRRGRHPRSQGGRRRHRSPRPWASAGTGSRPACRAGPGRPPASASRSAGAARRRPTCPTCSI